MAITYRARTITMSRIPTRHEVQACRCGHGADSHQHFRAGSDCSACACGRYRTTAGLASTVGALLRGSGR